MNAEVSPNTQAILLLTAPLMVGRSTPSAKPLAPREYRLLAHWLRELAQQPADLLDPGSRDILKKCPAGLDHERLRRLLERGFLLSQAVERWRTRAIWVVSRADADYPRRLKQRLGEDAPPVLYGCGDAENLNRGGLAVVGSRDVNNVLLEYSERVGRLAAAAGHALTSGGARGVDQAAMCGALAAGGCVAGVLADGLERAAMHREHRAALMAGRLVLISPYDPAARFLVGHAMQRNKLIYALSDAALVVNSDYNKGGTWAGAVEQLDKLKLVPVYVRTNGEVGQGIEALRELGARPWPTPRTPAAFNEVLHVGQSAEDSIPERQTNVLDIRDEPPRFEEGGSTARTTVPAPDPHVEADSAPANKLYATARELVERLAGLKTAVKVAEYLQIPETLAKVWLRRLVEEQVRGLFSRADACRSATEVADALQVSANLVRVCLQRLVEEDSLEKLPGRPVRYRARGALGPLFDKESDKLAGT